MFSFRRVIIEVCNNREITANQSEELTKSEVVLIILLEFFIFSEL